MKTLIVIAMLHLAADHAMPQPNCDVLKIAQDYAKSRWPVDLTSDRRVISWVEGNIHTLRFDLPEDTLGFVPEIGIDEKTCQVVSAILWQ